MEVKILFVLLFALPVSAFAEDVQYFNHDAVHKATVANGNPPLTQGAGYRVIMAERNKPGQVELHTEDLDIIYCLEGTAEFVTGGKAVGMKTTGSGEQRGDSIEGGVTRMLQPGDVMTIASGVPHWFKKINTPTFRYSVVKIPRSK